MADLTSIALDFIAHYGLSAIFVLLVLDGAMLLPIIPGELILILAVAQFGTNPAALVFLVILTTVAAMVGSVVIYWLMRGGGRRLVEKHPKLFMMSKRRREKLERLFQKPSGQAFFLFLRLFPLTRILVSIPAGLARMKFPRYVILSAIGLFLFNAGFLWLAYEFRQPDSQVAGQATALREAYASPAWDLVQANWIISGAVVLGLGVYLSLRASRRMVKDPEETAGSLIGALSTAVLFWGGLTIAVLLWLDPEIVYQWSRLGGLDVKAVTFGLPYEPVSWLGALAGMAILLGLLLRSVRRGAKRHRLEKMERRAEEERLNWLPVEPEPRFKHRSPRDPEPPIQPEPLPGPRPRVKQASLPESNPRFKHRSPSEPEPAPPPASLAARLARDEEDPE